jgi:predicted alpha/beta-hydrolase family hydrolase
VIRREEVRVPLLCSGVSWIAESEKRLVLQPEGDCVNLGYPFHPPGRPDRLRTAHLANLRTPALIVQGTRDPFGTPDEVSGYALARSIRICWIEDGDHSFKPRARSGRTERQNLEAAVAAVLAFLGPENRGGTGPRM